MKTCNACGQSSLPSFRFCPACGAAQETAKTGTQLSFDSKSGTESHVAQGAIPDRSRSTHGASLETSLERKHVTVLFADLCDSSAQIANIDPEDAKECLESALRAMSEAIHAYGGTVSQWLGDGMIALFGAPIAHEDHAMRACLAAIAIQKTACDKTLTKWPFTVRIGMHSGEVVVGLANDDFASFYRADGATIHLASRIEQVARPGTVLISQATCRLVADQLDVESVGTQAIRGLDANVELFELVTSGPQSTTPLVKRRARMPFTGRSELLETLLADAAEVRSGRLRITALRGEAGLGKSRLLSEAESVITASGHTSCTITARGYASRTPFAMVADMVRELARFDRAAGQTPDDLAVAAAMAGWPDDAQRHRAVVTDLLGLAPPQSAWKALTPAQRNREIVDTVAWLITRRQAEAPLLIVIDDLQYADRESVRLLELVVRRLNGLRVLVLLAYRPDFEHRWPASRVFTEHRIRPLPATQMQELATALLGDDPSLAKLSGALIRKADGNPLFLEQVAMTLIDEGRVAGAPGAYRAGSAAESFRVPGSIAAIIAARVDRLPAPSKSIVEAAAIVAEPISATLAGKLQDLSGTEANNHLALCEAAGLLTSQNDGTQRVYRFSHPLMQEAIVAALAGPRRKTLHRAACRALLEHSTVPKADRSGILAQHAWSAEMWREAAEFALPAIARSVARSANHDAVRMFSLGLNALDRLPESVERLKLELGLRLKALGAQLPLGQIDALVANLESAERLAAALGDGRSQANALIQLAVTQWMRGKHRLGLEASTRAGGVAIALKSRGMELSAVMVRMMLNHGLGNFRDVVSDARDLLAHFAAELNDNQFTPGWAVLAPVNVRLFLADSLWRLGFFDEGQRAMDAAYQCLEQNDHLFSRLLLDFNQATIWILQRRGDEAVTRLENAIRLCRDNDLLAVLPPLVSALGGALAVAGRPEEGLAILQKAIGERLDQICSRYDAFYFPKYFAVVFATLGRYDEAIAAAIAAGAAAETYEARGQQVEALLLRSSIERSAGHEEAAAGHLAQARSIGLECGIDFDVPGASPYWQFAWQVTT